VGWRERDYSQDTWAETTASRSGFRWPPRAAGVLIVLHLTAFMLVASLGSSSGGRQVVGWLALSDASAHPLGIVLHPLGTDRLLSLVLTIFVIWSLGGYLERQQGGRNLVGLYVVGNLAAGAAYFAIARWQPPLAAAALDYPTGAFTAWVVAACRSMAGGTLVLFGRFWRVTHLVMIGLGVAVALMLALRGSSAVGWLTALLAGGLAEPVVRGLSLVSVPRRRPRPRRVVRPSIPREILAPPATFDEPEIDDLLAKISRTGLASLTRAERARLEAARQAKLRKTRNASTAP